MWGLSAGTMITKEAKEPNNRVLLGALLFNCFVSFVVCNLCLPTWKYQFFTTNFAVLWPKTKDINKSVDCKTVRFFFSNLVKRNLRISQMW